MLSGCCQRLRLWLSLAADSCPCVEKLRAVLPLSDVIRDGVVQLVSTVGSVVSSAGAWARLHQCGLEGG